MSLCPQRGSAPYKISNCASASVCMCVCVCVCVPLFLYYHSGGCQLVHERFAQHEILHVDRINQKEEIKVGCAPKWLAVLQCHLSLLLSPITHNRKKSCWTHSHTRPNMAASAPYVCPPRRYYQSTQQIN